MQESHFDNLTGELVKKLSVFSPESERAKAVAAVKQCMDESIKNNEILSLTNDEVLLLTAYREWKVNNVSGSPVFHWKKP